MATLVARLRQHWTHIDQFGEVEGHVFNLLGEAADALEACEKVLSLLADKYLYPDDLGAEFAAELRADEGWDEARNDDTADDVWIDRRQIRAARAALAKLRGEP